MCPARVEHVVKFILAGAVRSQQLFEELIGWHESNHLNYIKIVLNYGTKSFTGAYESNLLKVSPGEYSFAFVTGYPDGTNGYISPY
jgi:hypothetical protein